MGVRARQIQAVDARLASDSEPASGGARTQLFELGLTRLERDSCPDLIEALSHRGQLRDPIAQIHVTVECWCSTAEVRVQVAIEPAIQIAEHRSEQWGEGGQAQFASAQLRVGWHAYAWYEARAPIHTRMPFGGGSAV